MQILSRTWHLLEKRLLAVFALYWRLFDAVYWRCRPYALVERKCLGKRLSFEEMPIVGLRVGYVFPQAEWSAIYVNGKPVSPWYKIKRSDQVTVAVRPSGDFGADILQIVVGVALLFVPGGQAIGTGLIVSGTTGILTKLLFPIETGEQEAFSTDQNPQITGAENTVSKSVVPVLFGKTKITPFYGQRPYRLVGDGTATNQFMQYFIPTYSNITVEQEKLGETPIADFSSDYLTVTRQFGGSTFIGYRNVKAVQVEQQLTYDTDESVNQIVEYFYNQSVSGSSLTYDFILTFTDVAVGDFSDKTFAVEVEVLNGATPQTLTQEFVVTEGDLTFVAGVGYQYTGTHTFTATITEITSTRFYAVTKTRRNVAEETAQTQVVIEEQEITCGAFNTTTTLGNGVNNYLGLLSQVVVASPENTTEADLVFSFPVGSYTQQSDGTRTPRGVNIDIQIKAENGTYQPIGNYTTYVRGLNDAKNGLGTTSINGSTVTFQSVGGGAADELFFRTIGINLPKGKYTIRVRSADLAAKRDVDVGYVVMSEMNFNVDGDPVNLEKVSDLAQYAVRAVAYGSLSGELKQFNFVGGARIPNWNGTDWSTLEVTENPASIIRYLLTDSRANPRPEPLSVIDNASLVELHEWCETKGYKADGLVVDQKRLLNVIQTILSNCQAAFTLLDGKYAFVIDDPSKPLVNQITPHNSLNFKWTPTIGKTTDAVRVSYLDGETYTQSEFTLYYYGGAVHEEPEAGKSDEDYEIIVQNAEYATDVTHLKTLYTENLKLLQEKRNLFEFDVNLEGLTLTLFDRIYVANTVNMTNSASGLIKEVLTSGGNVTGFKLYSKVEVASGDKITIRSIDMANAAVVVNSYDITNSGFVDVVNISPVVYNGAIKGKSTMDGFSGATWEYDGDIFEIGNDKMYECVILNIRYKEDLTATITAREA